MKVGAAKAILYLGANDISPLSATSIARYRQNSRQEMSGDSSWETVSLVTIGAVTSTLWGVKMHLYPYFPRLLPNWRKKGKFDIRHLHITTFIICELRQNWRKEDSTFLTVVNKITYTRVPWHCISFRKERTPWYDYNMRTTPPSASLAIFVHLNNNCYLLYLNIYAL